MDQEKYVKKIEDEALKKKYLEELTINTQEKNAVYLNCEDMINSLSLWNLQRMFKLGRKKISPEIRKIKCCISE